MFYFQIRLQSYEKTREEQNKRVCFFFRVQVTSRQKRKVTKKTREMQKGKGKTSALNL